jgi:hypothetical protein
VQVAGVFGEVSFCQITLVLELFDLSSVCSEALGIFPGGVFKSVKAFEDATERRPLDILYFEPSF